MTTPTCPHCGDHLTTYPVTIDGTPRTLCASCGAFIRPDGSRPDPFDGFGYFEPLFCATFALRDPCGAPALAAALGMHRASVFRAITDGRLGAAERDEVGSPWRIWREDVVSALASGTLRPGKMGRPPKTNA